MKSVAYRHTGQLDFRNWLADGSSTGYVTLRAAKSIKVDLITSAIS